MRPRFARCRLRQLPSATRGRRLQRFRKEESRGRGGEAGARQGRGRQAGAGEGRDGEARQRKDGRRSTFPRSGPRCTYPW